MVRFGTATWRFPAGREYSDPAPWLSPSIPLKKKGVGRGGKKKEEFMCFT